MGIFVLFSVHLYQDVTNLKGHKVFLVEDPLYFDRSSAKYGGLRFNFLKPVYHRATMKRYYDYLKSKNISCTYVDLSKDWVKVIKQKLKQTKPGLYFYDPVDRTLESKLNSNFPEYDMYDTLGHILTTEEMEEYDGALLQTSFYRWMRKREDILMSGPSGNRKPMGGKLTYDNENREPPYKDMSDDLPDEPNYNGNRYIQEALNYVKQTIPDKSLYVYGDQRLKDVKLDNGSEIQIKFPIDFAGSKARLKDFIKNYLGKFGPYQDVILKDETNSLIFHSGISPMLNIGLLVPEDVVAEVEKYAKSKGLASVEGFIRQILGWREFCRYTYQHHSKHYLGKNHFNAKNKLNKSWYQGDVGNMVVDNCIDKGFKYGYLHHIERLMVIANYMVLSRIHPKEMYRWFMEFALDSYDWVMEYNVYAMGSYSDGGTFTSKPYVSGSAYIAKMSDYSPKTESDHGHWSSDWDHKFWSFMGSNKAKIKKITRLSMLLKHATKGIKKASDQLKQIKKIKQETKDTD